MMASRAHTAVFWAAVAAIIATTAAHLACDMGAASVEPRLTWTTAGSNAGTCGAMAARIDSILRGCGDDTITADEPLIACHNVSSDEYYLKVTPPTKNNWASQRSTCHEVARLLTNHAHRFDPDARVGDVQFKCNNAHQGDHWFLLMAVPPNNPETCKPFVVSFEAMVDAVETPSYYNCQTTSTATTSTVTATTATVTATTATATTTTTATATATTTTATTTTDEHCNFRRDAPVCDHLDKEKLCDRTYYGVEHPMPFETACPLACDACVTTKTTTTTATHTSTTATITTTTPTIFTASLTCLPIPSESGATNAIQSDSSEQVCELHADALNGALRDEAVPRVVCRESKNVADFKYWLTVEKAAGAQAGECPTVARRLTQKVAALNEASLSWRGQLPIQLVLPTAGWASILWKSTMNAVVTLAEPFDATSKLTNAANINGGIVMIERGPTWDDEFGAKALRAEQAGAEAVLVVNDNKTMLADLGPGLLAEDADGAKVTIPVYMVNRADGMALVEALGESPTMLVNLSSRYNGPVVVIGCTEQGGLLFQQGCDNVAALNDAIQTWHDRYYTTTATATATETSTTAATVTDTSATTATDTSTTTATHRLIPMVLSSIFIEIPVVGTLSRKLQWQDPRSPDDAPVTKYELKIRKKGMVHWAVAQFDAANYRGEYYIDATEWGLAPNTMYEVGIRSENRHGWAPYPEDSMLGTFAVLGGL